MSSDPKRPQRVPDEPSAEDLERALRAFRWKERAFDPALLPERPPGGVRTARRPLAAAAVLLLAVGLVFWWSEPESGAPTYAFTAEGVASVSRAGAPVPARRAGSLRPGESLRTGEAGRARIEVGSIGSVELDPGSELRVASLDDLGDPAARHAFELLHGSFSASILAPARAFQVRTPSGVLVDLGCIYRAELLEDGATRLFVVAGQVAFESPAREVVVPGQAETRARPGAGPATPHWSDAPDSLVEALRAADASRGAPAAIDAVLRHRREADGLSLWNLIAWPELEPLGRARLVDALAETVPIPDGIPRADILAGRRDALRRWREAMSWNW